MNELHAAAGIECADRCEHAFHFQIGENGFEHELAHVSGVGEIVARDVELFALAQQVVYHGAHGRGGGRVAVGEILQRDAVVRARIEAAERRLAIPPGAPGFLHVVLERLRQVVVEDAADVRLINAHAERDGGHDEVALAGHEEVLRFRAQLVRQAGVIGARIQSGALEMRRHALGGFLERHIDNGRADFGA